MHNERLKTILEEHSVKSLSDFASLSRGGREHLDCSIYGWFASYKDNLVSDLRAQAGLNLCLSWDRRFKDFRPESAAGTDYEVRQLELQMRNIAKSRSLSAKGIALQLAAGVLCAFLPSDTAKLAGVLTGGGALKDLFAHFKTFDEKSRSLYTNPFYFPWLLYQQRT
jgi:hypothetical protein